MRTRHTTLRPNLTSVAFAEESGATNNRLWLSSGFRRFNNIPVLPKTCGIQPPSPLKHLSRCCFPFFHSKSRSGRPEIQTASRPRQSVSRLEIRSLGCSLCIAGTGPRETLGWRYSEEEASAENCWLAWHFKLSTCEPSYALILCDSAFKAPMRRSSTDDSLSTALASPERAARQSAPANVPGPRRLTRWLQQSPSWVCVSGGSGVAGPDRRALR